MSDPSGLAPGDGVTVGARVVGVGGAAIGTVDAVFADYLLVRTRGLLPVDLYIPVSEIQPADEGEAAETDAVRVTATNADAAYQSWHRPLKQAPHP